MEPQNNFPPDSNQPNVPPTVPISKPIFPVSPKKKKGVALMIIGLPLLIIASGFYVFSAYNKNNQTNFCLQQDFSKPQENIVADVVREFERFQSEKNAKALSGCLSQSFTSDLYSTNNPFPFYAILSYTLGNVSKISDEQYAINVTERRSIFKEGNFGGSYPEENIVANFVLKKEADGRWLIDSYNKGTYLPMGIIEGWRKYTNADYEYEIQYPPSFNLTPPQKYEEQTIQVAQLKADTKTFSGDVLGKEINSASINIWSDNNCNNLGVPTKNITTKSSKNIDGINFEGVFYEQNTTADIGDNILMVGKRTDYIAQVDNKCFLISTTYSYPPNVSFDNTMLTKLFDKILSTFKFTK